MSGIRRDAFSSYHPLINLIFFALVLSVTMLCMHPVILLISLICAALYYKLLSGERAVRAFLRLALPLILLTALINPLVSHSGQNILFYLPTGNPLTLESVFYGLSAGVMLGAVLLWFMCLSRVLTTDKYLYLFSRFSPSFSLLIAMTLRFIPDFVRKLGEVSDVQSTLNRDGGKNRPLRKVREAVSCFFAVFSQSLENAAQTADTMRARGFGTKKRTSYSVFRFDKRDTGAAVFLMFCGLFLLFSGIAGYTQFRFYPSVKVKFEPMTVMFLLVFFSLCVFPVYLEGKERLEWKAMKSEI